MNFDLSDDEEMFKAVAERFVADRYGPGQRAHYRREAHGFSANNWEVMGELGLIGALYSAADGGLGLGASGLTSLFEALGRGMVVEPLAETAILAGGILAGLASASLKDQWIADLVAGGKYVALAHREAKARGSDAWVDTLATPEGDGVRLSGEKSVVQAAVGAAAFIVSARTKDCEAGGGAFSFYLVPADSPGLALKPWRLLDGSVVATLSLDSVLVLPQHRLGGGLVELQTAHDRAALAGSAEALGIMETLFAETLEYLRTRQQFGVPLASFQALQHRMVAQYAVLEQARALLTLAAIEPSPQTISGARAFIAEKSVVLGHEMIQMHGGMGVTDELNIGHGHKRLMILARFPGDADAALDRFAGV